MELTHGRLKAALIAGKISVTDQALAFLQAGLVTIARGYHLSKVLRAAKTPTELRRELSRLYGACRTFLDVLDVDLNGLGQIEALLSDTWPEPRYFAGMLRMSSRGQLARLVGDLRAIYPRLEMAMLMVEQEQVKIPRRQNPATWFLLAVHDLFSEITGEAVPGIAGPLHRFTKRCAALIDLEIDVPESENSFHKRLTAALARRTGKIHVLPTIIFPGKRGFANDLIFPANWSE
jgi:hypothetical protein